MESNSKYSEIANFFNIPIEKIETLALAHERLLKKMVKAIEDEKYMDLHQLGYNIK